MSESVVLDSNVAIGLIFRNEGERAACRAAFPSGSRLVCSRYVIFEIARGFLLRLVELHNKSFEFDALSELNLFVSSGQRLYQPYKMRTWLGAVFVDFQTALEADAGPFPEDQKLGLLRDKLRRWVARGWRQLHQEFELINPPNCRSDLPAPFLREDGRLILNLPTSECGQPSVCGLQHFIEKHAAIVRQIVVRLETLPPSRRDGETNRRIVGLHHLLQTPIGNQFEGARCHHCGDAIICLEAGDHGAIATKNLKHFKPIAEVLGKSVHEVKTATTTKAPSDRLRNA